MRSLFLTTALAVLAAQVPAGGAEQKLGRWTLTDDQGICAAVLDTGEGSSLALVLLPGGGASFAIAGPDIPAAEPNSVASLRVTIDADTKVMPARATRRDSQTGYIVADPGLPVFLDQHPAGLTMTAFLDDKRIFSIDATKSAESIAAVKDCAATGHL